MRNVNLFLCFTYTVLKFLPVFRQDFFHAPGCGCGVIQPAIFLGEADEFPEALADAPLVDAEVLAQLVILVVLEDYVFIDVD